VLWLLVAVIVVSTVIFSGTKWTWAEALPVLWLGGASLFVMRLGPLFAEVTALACSSGWRHADRPATVRPLPFIAIDALLMVSMAVPLAVAESRCPTIGGPSAVDIVAAGALDSPQVRGRLELPFDWGEYAIWHFGPRLRVSMDGRRETVYSESTIELQSAVAHGGSDGIAFLDRVRPEYVWLPQATGGATRQWLLTHGYRLDVTTPDSFIATRADLPVLGPGTPLRRCFP
jgi:hypothetical protein